MALFKKSDPGRADLRDVLARKAELETRLDRLRAGRAEANDKLGKAVVAVRNAEAAFDESYRTLARETVAAIAEGREAPAAPDADALRAKVGAAEAERRGYEATVRHLGDEIAAIEDKLIYLTPDDAIAKVCAPKVRATLDALYAAESARLQAHATLNLLSERRLILRELEGEVAVARGLALGHPPGDPRSPIRAPDLSGLQKALDALRSDPDAAFPD